MTAPKVDRSAFALCALLAFLILAASSWAAQIKTEVVSPLTITTRVRGVPEVWRDEAASSQILVTVAPTVTAAQFQAMLDRQGGTLLKAMPEIRMYLVSLPGALSVVNGVARWAAEPGITLACPNRLKRLFRTPNDPLYPQQWQWPRIAATTCWDIQTGNATTVVAVIDTGYQFSHEDLSGKQWVNAGEIPGNGIDDDRNGYIDDVNGWNFVDGNNDPQPHPTDANLQSIASHGLHCSGLVGAVTDNNTGVAGQDWNCKIMPCKVFHEDGSGAFDDVLIPAMDYAVANGANVLSMSLGGFGYDPAFEAPMANARARGAVVCCSAGNSYWEFMDDPGTWFSPVCTDGPNPTVTNWVLGVAATDSGDRKADFSNYDGSSTKTFVDVSSPGVDVLSCVIFDPAHGFDTKYEAWSGTSMACPIVSGLVALLHAQYPAYDPLGLIAQVKGTTDNIDAINPAYAGKLGTGRINDAKALGYDFPPGPPKSVVAADTPNDEGGSITVTWSKSVDDGRGAKDVVRYIVYRADNKVVGGVDTPDNGTWAQKASVLVGNPLFFIDAPVVDGVKYWYKVSALDASNEVFSKNAGPVSARDDLPPPAPSMVFAADTQADDGGSISISWPGYDPPADFAGFRIYRATKSFTKPSDATLVKDLPGDSSISFYQDTPVANGIEFWYAVTAYDDAGNEAKTVTAVGPVVAEPNFMLDLPQGISMIAIGANVRATNMADLLSIAPADLKLLRWDPVLGAYHSFQTNPADPFLTPAPGRGYWIALDTPLLLDLGGIPVTTDPFPIPLSTGWNQIGNPFLHSIVWQNLHVSSGGTSYSLAQSNTLGITRDYAWTYDSFTGSYRLVSSVVDFGDKTIAQGAGFWFLAFQNCSLTVPALAPVSTDTPKPVALDVAWKIKLTARCGQSADYDNFLGVSSAAASLNTIVSPPRPSGGPELYFVNQGVDGLAAASFVGPADTARWQARVQVAGLGGQDVEIAWPDLSSLPANLRPMLTDKATGKRVYMRTAAAYHFTPSAGEAERAFEITLAQSSVLAVSALAARPSGQGVDLVFTLSAPATVSGQVLNLSGRVVQELPAAAMDAGPCHVQWTGLGRSGARAPAGQYLVRLTARTPDGQEVSGLAQARLGR